MNRKNNIVVFIGIGILLTGLLSCKKSNDKNDKRNDINQSYQQTTNVQEESTNPQKTSQKRNVEESSYDVQIKEVDKIRHKNPELALEKIKEFIGQSPNAAKLYIVQGEIYQKLGKFNEAEKSIFKAMEVGGDSIKLLAFRTLGAINIFSNNYNKAEEYLIESINSKGTEVDKIYAHYDLSILYLKMGNLKEAEKYFKISKNLSSDDKRYQPKVDEYLRYKKELYR